MPKKVYIIHRWGGDSTSDWVPWLKEELKKNGIDAIAPDMPDTNNPDMERWIGFLSGIVQNPDKDTYFVGYSIGCQTIIRYLSTLPEGNVVGGAVFVAPWTILTNVEGPDYEIARPWIETPMPWGSANKHAERFVVIYSDNDKYVPESEAKEFELNLKAKLVLEKNRGHFSDDDDVTQLPALLRELLSMIED